MKSVPYHCLPPHARFQLDDQWWIKVDGKSAKHSTFELSIDMKRSCPVLIAGDEQATTDNHDDGRKQMRKREGFFLLLGTFLESFHLLG